MVIVRRSCVLHTHLTGAQVPDAVLLEEALCCFPSEEGLWTTEAKSERFRVPVAPSWLNHPLEEGNKWSLTHSKITFFFKFLHFLLIIRTESPPSKILTKRKMYLCRTDQRAWRNLLNRPSLFQTCLAASASRIMLCCCVEPHIHSTKKSFNKTPLVSFYWGINSFTDTVQLTYIWADRWERSDGAYMGNIILLLLLSLCLFVLFLQLYFSLLNVTPKPRLRSLDMKVTEVWTRLRFLAETETNTKWLICIFMHFSFCMSSYATTARQ